MYKELLEEVEDNGLIGELSEKILENAVKVKDQAKFRGLDPEEILPTLAGTLLFQWDEEEVSIEIGEEKFSALIVNEEREILYAAFDTYDNFNDLNRFWVELEEYLQERL